MWKKRLLLYSLILILVLVLFFIHRSQVLLAWSANQKIQVTGIKLMMPESQIREQLGEGMETPGFGGYLLEYPALGIRLTFLNDPDTNFHQQVQEITTASTAYEIYGIRVGDPIEQANLALERQRFRADENDLERHWRGKVYIRLYRMGEQVDRITVGIQDLISRNRVY